jgi:hypothetical protein
MVGWDQTTPRGPGVPALTDRETGRGEQDDGRETGN